MDRRPDLPLLGAPGTVEEVLTHGELDVLGRLTAASNVTLLVAVTHPDGQCCAVYKPVRGEAPLWDFPDGTLAARERAAYLVSEASGWQIVPPTVLRDGPYGPGMVQVWVEPWELPDETMLDLVRGTGSAALRRIALLDVVMNNGDRKGGHLIPVRPTAEAAADGTAEGTTDLPVTQAHVFGVDHGVCFHVEDKLRTVLWQWRGQRLDAAESAALARVAAALAGALGRDLADLLTPAEVARTRQRVDDLLERARLPSPVPGRPALPWPPW